MKDQYYLAKVSNTTLNWLTFSQRRNGYLRVILTCSERKNQIVNSFQYFISLHWNKVGSTIFVFYAISKCDNPVWDWVSFVQSTACSLHWYCLRWQKRFICNCQTNDRVIRFKFQEQAFLERGTKFARGICIRYFKSTFAYNHESMIHPLQFFTP